MASALSAAGMDIPLIIGGIVPDEDVEELMSAGIAAVLGPGASAEEVVATVQNAISARDEA
jgi:methylmalonyl-CoA mutase C-terminal domain/subunit